ncbi:hypothetical protein ACU8L2_31935 (plasmid) [Rhizobium leguminosarum]
MPAAVAGRGFLGLDCEKNAAHWLKLASDREQQTGTAYDRLYGLAAEFEDMAVKSFGKRYEPEAPDISGIHISNHSKWIANPLFYSGLILSENC